MVSYELVSKVGLVIWLVAWLPGLYLFAVRASRLLAKGQRIRTFVESVIIISIPVLGWAGYGWAKTMMQLEAGHDIQERDLINYLVQIVYPYAAAGAVILLLHSKSDPNELISVSFPVLVGVLVAPVASISPFFSLLMVLFGGW